MSADGAQLATSPRTVGHGVPPVSRRFGQPGGNPVNRGGKRPKGLAEMRRTIRAAFDLKEEDRSLTRKLIALARGEDLRDLVVEIVAAAGSEEKNAAQVIQAIGSVLNAGRAVQLKAIEACKRIGFGKEDTSLDEETIRKLGMESAQQMLDGMIAEAEARKAEQGGQPIDTTATVADVGTDE